MFQRIAIAFFLLATGLPAQGISWLGDYQEALREAKKTGKPIFLEFRCEA